jgi:hypothetical protein
VAGVRVSALGGRLSYAAGVRVSVSGGQSRKALSGAESWKLSAGVGWLDRVFEGYES